MAAWTLPVVAVPFVINLLLLVIVHILGRRMYIARGLMSSDETVFSSSQRIVAGVWQEWRERRRKEGKMGWL